MICVFVYVSLQDNAGEPNISDPQPGTSGDCNMELDMDEDTQPGATSASDLEEIEPDIEDIQTDQPGLDDSQPDTEDIQPGTSGEAQLLELNVDDEDQQPGRIQHSAAISLV